MFTSYKSVDFTAKRHAYHDLKGDIISIILKGLLFAKKVQNHISNMK